MIEEIKRLMLKHNDLVQRRFDVIQFNLDHEGKRLLNKEINKLYSKIKRPSDREIVDIVINCHVIIEKMSDLKKCDWDITELYAQLEGGLKYNDAFSTRSKLDNNSVPDNLHVRYPATLKTLDGHLVRSKSEMLIDNFLYINGITHAYDKKLPITELAYCDFYIPVTRNVTRGVYIEYWGLDDEEYLKRKAEKVELYIKYKLPLIEIKEIEISNLEEILTTKLLEFKIDVYHQSPL